MTGADAGTEAVRVTAVHLDGIKTLSSGRSDLELRISAEGVQIYDQAQRAPLGRLGWSEIAGLEVIPPRRLPRRRDARLILTGPLGRARFALPGLSRRQLARDLTPALRRYR